MTMCPLFSYLPIVFLANSLSLINLGYEIVLLRVEDILLCDSEFILAIFDGHLYFLSKYKAVEPFKELLKMS